MLSIEQIAEVKRLLPKYRFGVKPSDGDIEKLCQIADSVEDAVGRIVASSFTSKEYAFAQRSYAIAKIYGDGAPSKN